MGAIRNRFVLFFLLILSGQSYALTLKDCEKTPVDTEAAIKQLNECATLLLSKEGALQKEADAEFTRLGLDSSQLPRMESMFLVHIPETNDCFDEAGFGRRVFSDYDINGPDDYSIMWLNFKSAAIFTKIMYVASRAQNLGHFQPRTITFCPSAKNSDRHLSYQDRTLTVGVPNPGGLSFLDKFSHVTSQHLLKSWNEGEIYTNNPDGPLETVEHMLSGFLKKDPGALGQKLWILTNPIGHIRSTLREHLQISASKLKVELESAKIQVGEKPENARANMEALIKENVDHEKITEEMEGQSVQQWLSTLTPEQLEELRQTWVKQLSGSAVTEAAGEAVMGEVQSAVFEDIIKVHVKQDAFLVAVENNHVLQFNLTTAKKTAKKFVVVSIPRTVERTVDQKAWVTVSTQDVISGMGNLDVNIGKLFESVSFLGVKKRFEDMLRRKGILQSN